MIPGVEAAHRWNDGIILSQNIDLAFPRYWLRRIGGWRARPDVETKADPAWGRSGELVRQSFTRGKTLTYAGTIEARTYASLKQAEADLATAFAEQKVGRMTVTAPVATGLPTVEFFAEPLSGEGDDEWTAPPTRTTFGFERPFMVGMRLQDPRFFETASQVVETGTLSGGTGLKLPAKFPQLIPAPGATFGTVTLTNAGSADAEPIIDLYGPVLNPRIYNDALGGAALSLPGLRLPSGSYVRLDFARRQVLGDGVTDYFRYLDLVASSWWHAGTPGLIGTRPGRTGSNPLRYRGDEMTSPAKAVITYRRAHH